MIGNNQGTQWEGARKKCRGPNGGVKGVVERTWEGWAVLPELNETTVTCALLPNSRVNVLPF